MPYIAHMSNEMHENHTQFSEEAWDELNVAMEAVREVINITYDAFLNDDKEEAQRIQKGLSHHIWMDVTYYPQVNEWRGQKNIQIVIQNYRFKNL